MNDYTSDYGGQLIYCCREQRCLVCNCASFI